MEIEYDSDFDGWMDLFECQWEDILALDWGYDDSDEAVDIYPEIEQVDICLGCGSFSCVCE